MYPISKGARCLRCAPRRASRRTGYTKIRFSSAPTWTWILLLFGIFPFLIAGYFATVHVEGIVPMSDVAQRRVTVFNRLFIGLVALGAVVIVVGCGRLRPRRLSSWWAW